LCRKGIDHRVPGKGIGAGKRPVQRRQAGLVSQQPADQEALLALGGELGPVGGDRRVQVQFASLDEQQRAGSGRRFGGGINDLQGVVLPRPGGLGIGDAAPQVGHRSAVQVHADRRAHFRAVGEVRRERLADRLESWRGLPHDLGHPSPFLCHHGF
jgi:hypothetical protein